MIFSAAVVAKHLEGEVVGDAQTELKGFAPADRAQAGDLTFAETDEFFARAEQSAATAIIVGSDKTSSAGKILIRVANPRVAFAKALALFFPEPPLAAGIHPTAVVARTAQVDNSVHVGPHCVIGQDVIIGGGTILHANNYVGDRCRVGVGCVLFPNATLYPRTELGDRVRIHAGVVIGADGFGYVLDKGAHRKVPQVGNVIIGDDVEIGANTTVDRGALGPTMIGKGTKIDNLVQIAHNVRIGEHCIIVAQVGIAGSSKLGNYVIIAGQAGIGGHLQIGDKVTIAAQSGVMHNIPEGLTVLGSPALPDKQTKRQVLAIQRLPDLLRRVSKLEKKLGLGGDDSAA